MRINHNIAALNTYNKLSANTAATSKSLEKLSSGLKINRAGDNAAGLAISEKMRGQISGLNTASSNASDGISLIQTAEGALNETHSILQRMRELAVQSSNDTNTTADREEIQKEIDQLTSEVDRISNDTEFNTQKLLNGDKATRSTESAFKNAAGTSKDTIISKTTIDGNIQTGTYDAKVTVTNARHTQEAFVQTNTLTDGNGAVAKYTVSGTTSAKTYAGAVVRDVAGATVATSSGAYMTSAEVQNLASGLGLAAGSYTIKTTISGTATTKATFELQNASGTVLATGVAASVGTAAGNATFTGLDSKTATVAYTNTNGGGVAGTASAAITVQNAYKIGAGLVNADNAKDATGITVDIAANAQIGDQFTIEVGAATGPTLNLDKADLEIGNYSLVVSAASGAGTTATVTLLDSAGNIAKDASGKNLQKIGESTTGVIEFGGITIAANSIKGNSTTEFEITTAQKATVALTDNAGKTATGIKFKFNDTVENNDTFKVTVDANNAMKFQIGANEGQSTSLSINEMGAKKLGIDKLNLTTQSGADAAITTIDDAITSVSSERAKLGAVQNRLEHTINNLGTSSENLSSAESRIRDVDMAKEMMEFTKNNILSQAAQSMLAQANQQPQGVLQLLQ